MTNFLDLTIYQGATFRKVLTFKTPDGIPIDQTGKTFRGKARKLVTDTSEAFSFSFTIRDQITNTGEVEMELSATASSAVSVTEFNTKFLYDVEVEDSGGDVTRILQGSIVFVAEITK